MTNYTTATGTTTGATMPEVNKIRPSQPTNPVASPVPTIDPSRLLPAPLDSKKIRILGIDYTHFKTSDGGDLFITEQGLPFVRQLMPESWHYENWVSSTGTLLEGGSARPKLVQTREVDGKALDLVVKTSRVGQVAYIGTDNFMYNLLHPYLNNPDDDSDNIFHDEYNTPFHEVAIASDLRGNHLHHDRRVLSQRPLAIYSPSSRIDLDRSERKSYLITGHNSDITASQEPIPEDERFSLDPERNYILLYGWVKGANVLNAFKEVGLDDADVRSFIEHSFRDIEGKGFVELDMKPIHLIVRPKSQRDLTINEYQRIPGVTPEIAQAMWDNNLRSVDALKEAPVDLLTSIDGIDDTTASACMDYSREKLVGEYSTSKRISESTARNLFVSGFDSWDKIRDASFRDVYSVPGVSWRAARSLKRKARLRMVNELKRVYGVNRRTAESLYRRGYTKLEDIESASVEELTKIRGVDEKTAGRLKKYAEDKKSGEAKWLLKKSDGEVAYALIDFELLRATPEYHKKIEHETRRKYWDLLVRSSKRVEHEQAPPGVSAVSIMGVNYLYQSFPSGTKLWVVGNEPGLLPYFHPEKWTRGSKERISERTFRVGSSDGIHMVIRNSRMGETPKVGYTDAQRRLILEHGYNSPFEDVQIALDLLKKGFSVIRPRGIYMSSTARSASEAFAYPPISSRYGTHKHIVMPDGSPILDPTKSYLNIWSDWRGVDFQANYERDGHWGALGSGFAYHMGMIDSTELTSLIAGTKLGIQKLGFKGASVDNLSKSDILIRLDKEGRLMRTGSGGLNVTLNTNLDNAQNNGFIAGDRVQELIASMEGRISKAGYTPLLIQPSDLFITFSPDGRINADTHGDPVLTLVNFNLLRPKQPILL